MFTYTRALIPKPGDTVASRVVASQAAAMNDRLKLGPSVPWRVVWYLFSAFKQIRNSDASGFLFPSQDEFFTFYQNLKPNDAQWPDAGPGDPEGANLASQMPSFVFGNGTAGVDAEDERIADETAGGIEMNAGTGTPEELWNLAKRQRGAYDPRTGAIGSPALTAAASHAYLRQQPTAPSAGSSWGDYLPGPAYLGPCDGSEGSPASYTLKFTELVAPFTVRTYGTCPANPGDARGVVSTPFANIVFKFDGTFDTLPKKKWIEGPYTDNPTLRKTENGFLDRAINAFVADFRGTDAQRASGEWCGAAFLTHEVLTTQYHLAPQRGSTVGSFVAPKYPRWESTGLTGRTAAGTMIPMVVGGVGSWYKVGPGFTSGAAFVRVKKLVGSTSVDVIRDGEVVGTIQLTADDAGAASGILAFDRPAEGGQFGFRFAAGAAWDGTGEVRAEITELMTYKPSLADIYLILRCGGVDFGAIVDGVGTECPFAREISEDYLANGVIRSHNGDVALPGSLGPINTNAVFDAARRLSQAVRIMPSNQMTAYAIENGKSVIWFNRYARGMGHSTPIDLFEGLGPDREQVLSGEIVWGRKYIVRGTGRQAVNYAGRIYGVGQTFVGRSDVSAFKGDGQVWEADGIRAKAEPQGFSNRWLMGLNLVPYRQQAESQWKPESFAGFWTMIDRCVFGDQAIAADKLVVRHVAYGNRIVSPYAVLTPEMPESHRYMPTPLAAEAGGRANRILCDVGDTTCEDQRRSFYASCRLFEPWPEVESVVMDGDQVKVTFQTRIHHHPDAPSSIDRDRSGWDISALRSEGYRTWENGLREKLVFDDSGTNGSIKIGDQAWNSLIGSEPDHPWGSIWPHFLWVKLVPEPWVDGNDDLDEADTPMVHDMYPQLELYMRAACEGFVDGHTSAESACAYGATDLYSFTFENLCYRAFAGRWMTTIGSGPTSEVGIEETRPDKPQGFGYLPNTLPFAEVAANFSRALNLMTRFRVMIPASLQMRTGGGAADVMDVPVVNGANASANGGSVMAQSGSGSTFAISYHGPFSLPGITSLGGWADSFAETVGAAAILNWDSGHSRLSLSSGRIDYRWEAIGDAIYALPAPFQDMLSGSPMVIASVTRLVQATQQSLVSGAFAGRQCHPLGNPADEAWGDGLGGSNAFQLVTLKNETTCQIVEGGSLSPDPLPAGVAAGVDSVGDPNPDNRCYDGPSSSVAIWVSATTTPAISVPLVDLVESVALTPP